jgi:RNA polymerase sigma-70 factor (ECF subfamily)
VIWRAIGGILQKQKKILVLRSCLTGELGTTDRWVFQNLWGNFLWYQIVSNSIQRELYCPCFFVVLYLIPTQLVSNKPPGEAAAMNSQTVLSDEALIASARSGNRNAFGEIVRRHSGRVYGVSLKMLKNREDAEDNLQNVFCKAYCRIRQFEGNSKFSTWLVRIAINEALMMLRKRRPGDVAGSDNTHEATDDHERKEELWDLHADPERQYLTKELAAKVLDALTPTLRCTFILQKGEGWTSCEVAQALNTTAETVKSRIFRARVRMRERLLAISKTKSIALQS